MIQSYNKQIDIKMLQTQQQNDVQAVSLTESSPSSNDSSKTPKTLFLLFCYLYFVQGAIMGIVATMPYVHASLPDVHTMALFNSVSLPYSLKFLIAPLLERYSMVQYGKRKTWIIISQLLTGLLLFLSSFYTELEEAQLFAGLSMAMMVGMVLQNIALHSLIVKQITNAHESSMIQSFAEVFGSLVGGLILLKLTSTDFASKMGLAQPITTPQTVLVSFSYIILIPLAVIHFKFREKVLQSERMGSTFPLCKIISYYKVFLSPATKYFRFCVFMLIFNQGINFFNSLFQYQLVKAGFSRDTYNTISNITIIPIIFITFRFKTFTNYAGGHLPALLISTLISLFFLAYMLIVFPLQPWIMGIWYFLVSLLDSWRFFIFGVMINEFPLHGLSGMYITLLGSFFNFGRLTAVQTELCGIFGWKQMSLVGLGLQVVILVCSKKMFDWVERGECSIPAQFQNTSDKIVKSVQKELSSGTTS